MADARALTLKAQMADAAATHLRYLKQLTPEQISRISDFEQRIYSAQQYSNEGGALNEGGAEGGPRKLLESEPGRLGAQGIPVWTEFKDWANASEDDSLTPEQ